MLTYALLMSGVYLAAVLDGSLATAWEIGSVRPDLLGLAAIGWSLISGRPRTAVIPAAIGLLADLSGPGRLGIGMACFALVGCAAGHLRPRFIALPLWARAAALAPAIAVQSLSIGLIRATCGEIELGFLAVSMRCAGVGGYTAAIALPLLMLHEWARQTRWQ